MSGRSVFKGSVDQDTTIRIVDSTDGTPEVGVVWNTAGIDLWYRRQGGALVSITEATLASLSTAHADGGFLHIADGYYRLDGPDAAWATGADHVTFAGTVPGMVVIGNNHPLVGYNPQDAVRLGLTALPNAVFGGIGGLDSPIVDTGTAQGAGPGANTLQFRAAAPTTIQPKYIVRILTATTGAGQLGVITTYTPGTQQAVFQDDWAIALTGTITYEALKYSSATDPATLPELAEAVGTFLDAGGSVKINTIATEVNSAKAAIGIPTDLGAGPTVAGNLVDIEAQTDDIGALGAGLTGVATAVWAYATRILTAATNITSTGAATFTQTGDAFVRLGAPAGASVSADIAAVQADLPIRITKNTAHNYFKFYMARVPPNAHLPLTGATVTVQHCIDDAASFTNIASPTATEIGSGWYKVNYAQADLNGNDIAFKATAVDGLQVNWKIVTGVT